VAKPPIDLLEQSQAELDSDELLPAIREDLLAIAERDLLPVNADLSIAAPRVIVAAERIQEHRAELVAIFGKARVSRIDRLVLFARAALHAYAKHKVDVAGTRIAPVAGRARQRRAVLHAEVRSLVTRGLLPATVTAELKGGKGFKNLFGDVLQLVGALRFYWKDVEDRTGVTLEELAAAEQDAMELATMIGEAKYGGPRETALTRQRVFTLLFRTYDEARRMIAFLRWKEGDVEHITPSLLGGSGTRRKLKKKEGAEPQPAHV